MVVCRGDFHHIATDEVQVTEATQDRLELPRREPARFRRPGPWRVGRIEDIDVHAQVRRPGSNALADPRDGDVRSVACHVCCRDDGEPHAGILGQVLAGVERAADPDVY